MSLWQDARYGARQLRQSPAFTLVAIASLALGIGANTAIFQLLDAVRLRGLPVPNPGELAEVRIAGENNEMGVFEQYGSLTRPIWKLLQPQQQSFSGMFAWGTDEIRVGRDNDLKKAHGLLVSGDFFRVLGVKPYKGRLLLAEDEKTCPATLGVVSYTYWQTRMGGVEIGPDTFLVIEGQRVRIAGVTPPEFFGMSVGDYFDIALPHCQPAKPLRNDVFDITVMGRLRPGISAARATAELNALSAAIFAATTSTGYDPKTVETYKRFRLAAYPAASGVSQIRRSYNAPLLLLLGIAGLVLLIACANLANLMLARANARQREFAVRMALGAGRWRIIRQLLAESALLAATGAALGLALAQLLSRLLVWSLQTETDIIRLDVATDWRVLLFATGAATLTCLLFGVLPAIRGTNAEPATAMKSGGRGMTAGRERFAVQRLMVVTQISVSLVLVVAAILFVRSFTNLLTLNPGMRETGITVLYASFSKSALAPARWAGFRRELLEEVRTIPGIRSAAATTLPPLLGAAWRHGVHVGAAEGFSMFAGVSDGYLQTMGVPLLAGRDLSAADTAASPRVALVNSTFVRKYLHGDNPLGKTLKTVEEPGYPSAVYQIIGVIADSHYGDIRDTPPPLALVPATQYPAEDPWTSLMIYGWPSPAATAAVKSRFAVTHPEVSLDSIDFERRIHDGLVRERLMAMLAGFFGLLAMLLAAVGIYGTAAYMVSRRRNEIGVRMALGARRSQVVRMIIGEICVLLLAGLGAGAALSLLAGKSAASLLFGLKPWDPATMLFAALLLSAIAILSVLLPATRASKQDPMTALRCD